MIGDVYIKHTSNINIYICIHITEYYLKGRILFEITEFYLKGSWKQKHLLAI